MNNIQKKREDFLLKQGFIRVSHNTFFHEESKTNVVLFGKYWNFDGMHNIATYNEEIFEMLIKREINA